MLNVALIPVRGGSKSIPRKNIKEMNGKPLVYWTIKAAVECKYIDIVYVATDDEEINNVVNGFNFDKVKVIKRSAETATDTAPTELVMIEFASNYTFDNIVLIQATSPLLETHDLNLGFEKLNIPGVDSVLSVVEQKRFIWKEDTNGYVKPINYEVSKRPRRQDFEDSMLVENGAFYITRRECLLRTNCRVSGNIVSVKMAPKTYWEIDEPSDFGIVSAFMQLNVKSSVAKCHIKLFITDCDGCLTDGGMYLSENGDELKKFNTQDGKGIQLLRQMGVKTGIITGENNELVRRRAEKLNVDYLRMGIEDKRSEIVKICRELNIDITQVAYVGDDINDIDAMEAVGYSCSVFNALESVKKLANYVSPYVGGNGAVRDCIEHLISQHYIINKQ